MPFAGTAINWTEAAFTWSKWQERGWTSRKQVQKALQVSYTISEREWFYPLHISPLVWHFWFISRNEEPWWSWDCLPRSPEMTKRSLLMLNPSCAQYQPKFLFGIWKCHASFVGWLAWRRKPNRRFPEGDSKEPASHFPHFPQAAWLLGKKWGLWFMTGPGKGSTQLQLKVLKPLLSRCWETKIEATPPNQLEK